eukprot:gene16815-19167_t
MPMRGAQGEELAMDVAVQGPADAAQVLMTTSAVHGIEGFCGSAIQTGLLHSLSLPPGVAVVHVHAVNPHGFSHARRVNEDNVDLNRNFIAVWLCGFTLNFMTLLGLSLAIGVLIDDAIVVRENIVRHMQMGSDRRKAALDGTAEIGLAVAATTFSIMAVFIPVAFMPGMPGEWFRPFALTVTCSVAVSLFISFTLDPMLSAYWGDPADHHTAQKKGIGKALDKFNHWFDHQADRYGKVIAWALHHRRWMAVIAFASFAGAIALQVKWGGTWKDLTDNVNFMASNLTGQVRNIAAVTTAVARGDLSKKITVDVKGEILELKDTINVMVDQLSSFASEVTRVAREVGTEGKLGGQANVSGVAGTWKDLTENVNQLAANLTNQVRAIAEVATAVTRGAALALSAIRRKGLDAVPQA